ncbi:Fungal-trans domain-containing protein [Mycena kentingensis (nom. inval.)]|nr:Fungal-trans domain-containing protein [Mycena kentingensis (nom. inval.)]
MSRLSAPCCRASDGRLTRHRSLIVSVIHSARVSSNSVDAHPRRDLLCLGLPSASSTASKSYTNPGRLSALPTRAVLPEPGPTYYTFEVQPSKAKTCVNCRQVYALSRRNVADSPPRRRKIKCDGIRPQCGPCARSMGFKDCEYEDDGPTRTQQLEEQIRILEGRIEELSQTRPVPQHVLSERRSNSLPAPTGDVYPPHSTFSSPEPGYNVPSMLSAEMQPVELEELVLNFLDHCTQFGFFLRIQTFRVSALGRTGARPSPALMHAVYLWAVHLCGRPNLTAMYEATYLSRALRSVVVSLSSGSSGSAGSGGGHNTPTHTHGQPPSMISTSAIIQTIQAEVLLAHYFFRTTRFLEGKYHLSAAMSLVLSSGLHRLRSSESAGASGGWLGTTAPILAPPQDAVEDMERIAAFWTVLTMNNCWTTADGSASNIAYSTLCANEAPEARIDTPWPVELNSDHLDISTTALPELSFGTVTAFLANQPDSATSLPALHAKAAILFEQASRLAAEYRPQLPASRASQFYTSFNAMDALIERFTQSLPGLDTRRSIDMAQTRDLFLVHVLARVAAIQLHNPFVDATLGTTGSRRRAMDAARAVVADAAAVAGMVGEFGFVDPIMGTLLMATAQVFIAELRRSRHELGRGHTDFRRLAGPEDRALMDSVERVLAVMALFAPTCRLMDSQLKTMREAYEACLSS